jgi:hypothetical protein
MGNRYAVTDPTCCRIEQICRMWSAHDKKRRLGKTEAAL